MKKSTLYNPQSTILNRCDNCCFSTWIIGLSRYILMCRQKVNFVGKRTEIRLTDSCANFYPTTNFKLNLHTTRPIPLTNRKFAIVDHSDYYRLSQFQWFINSNGTTFYAVRKQNGKVIRMHRVIMNAPSHLVVDHIDHNGLNNCRSNLRLCSQAQNNCNSVSRKGSTSSYKGVSWHKGRKKWLASMKFSGKLYKLGFFADEIIAAKAYDEKASQLHGEFACLNFPQ